MKCSYHLCWECTPVWKQKMTFFKKTFVPRNKKQPCLDSCHEGKRIISPSRAIILKDSDFEHEVSILLDQSTFSTLTHELNLDAY